MDRSAKIYVAGHTGLVGSAITERLRELGYRNLVLKTHGELELTDQAAVGHFFSSVRPQYVFLAAAKVGGILANSTLPAEFIFNNLRIQSNVIHESCRTGVERLLFLGSSCIYPKLTQQPITERALLTGPLELTNRSYAIAKISGIEMCWAYNRQYGTRFLAAMPTNLYGPGDNYDSQYSHLIPGLIRKMHEAKLSGAREVVVWGTGRPRREFLYSKDAADACILLMNLPSKQFTQLVTGTEPPLVNVGVGTDMTIAAIAELVADVVGFKGTIVFDSSKPDGTPRKLLDISLITSLGWKSKMPLMDGLRLSYGDFCSRAEQEHFALSATNSFL
jgi:GDP-L-fucose synthase